MSLIRQADHAAHIEQCGDQQCCCPGACSDVEGRSPLDMHMDTVYPMATALAALLDGCLKCSDDGAHPMHAAICMNPSHDDQSLLKLHLLPSQPQEASAALA